LAKAGTVGKTLTLAFDRPWSLNCSPVAVVMVAVYASGWLAIPVAALRCSNIAPLVQMPASVPVLPGSGGVNVFVPVTVPAADVIV
jgi:hypothetical protein